MRKISMPRLWLAVMVSSGILLTMTRVPVEAAQLTDRSLVVSSAAPSATVDQTFLFTYATADPMSSLSFEYCDSPVFDYPCNAPVGLDVTSANLDNQSGNAGFNIDGVNTTSNRLVLTRPAVVATTVASQYDFSNVTNSSVAGQTVYVRITTYVSADGSGPFTDNGAVAYATNSPLSIGADVPPFLQMCVGVTVATSCSTASGDRIDLGNLSTSSAKTGTSQFAGGTNAVSGYTVFILGTTMTSGNNTIKAISSPSPSFPGNNQFGINLRDNSVPNIGSNPSGAGSAAPMANYNTSNLYKYQNGEAIARSTLPSDYNRMTVSYLININDSQAPGTYASTFTYLATATF